MKKNYHSRKTVSLIMFAFILIFTSCNSKKLTSDYPNIYSVNHKKHGFRSDYRHKTDHSKITFKNFANSNFSSVSDSESLSKSEEKAAAQLNGNAAKTDIRLIPSMSSFPIPDYNVGTLTASLSDEPSIPMHRFRPDTTIKTIVPVLDTNNKLAQPPPTNAKNHENGKVTEKTNREIFAIISPIAVLFAILTLILALPVLTFTFLIAAIVFGALGLKSRRKNLAKLGMTLGIVFSAILLILIIAFLLSPPIAYI
jgi:hypothetical protein